MSADKKRQTQDDLNEHLREHLEFLRSSADSYDNGYHGEAKRMAVSIRVLLHDTKHSKSLSGQLGLKERDYISTCSEYDPTNPVPFWGLISLFTGNKESKSLAMLDDVGENRLLPFDEWWNEPVFVDDNKEKLSRKDIALAIANQDGGAHVDPGLDNTYAGLSRENSIGLMSSKNGNDWIPIQHPERTAIRQITHEVLKTFVPGYIKKPKIEGDGYIIGGIKIGFSDTSDKVEKVGRNEPCPCGSGKKYKKCHGKNT